MATADPGLWRFRRPSAYSSKICISLPGTSFFYSDQGCYSYLHQPCRQINLLPLVKRNVVFGFQPQVCFIGQGTIQHQDEWVVNCLQYIVSPIPQSKEDDVGRHISLGERQKILLDLLFRHWGVTFGHRTRLFGFSRVKQSVNFLKLYQQGPYT